MLFCRGGRPPIVGGAALPHDSMIVPEDKDYRDTKRIKAGGLPLPPMFQELAHWISQRYGVYALNIILDTIEPGHRPRLSVIFEYAADAQRFRKPPNFVNFDPDKQTEIREAFVSIAGESLSSDTVSRLFVTFSAFEPVARMEANARVADSAIEKLMSTVNCPDLWKIRKGLQNVTFFFYTDAQARANEGAGSSDRFEEAYAKLTAAYDEFGYLAKRPILVQLDSKENFESFYRSNWFYYDRDH
jgi:hypothetical protein